VRNRILGRLFFFIDYMEVSPLLRTLTKVVLPETFIYVMNIEIFALLELAMGKNNLLSECLKD
jgi:hypothetical protein